MNARTCCGVVASCLLATVATTARALPVSVPRQVVTVGSTYVVSEITIYRGDTLRLTNLDNGIAHDLVSLKLVGGVHVFGSGPAATGESVDVAGVSSLPTGHYTFYCSLHASMLGNITVEAAPAR
jgi:plastocyanin